MKMVEWVVVARRHGNMKENERAGRHEMDDLMAR
jgi:hypothetical protein